MGARTRLKAVTLGVVLGSTALWVAPAPAVAATFTVTSIADDGPGTLRAAIVAANADTAADTIDFDIPGTGPHTITLATELPILDRPVVIDATTQDGFDSCDEGLMVELDGSQLSGTTHGFTVRAAVTIRGLAIHSFAGPGSAAIDVQNNSGVVECSYLGTDAAGTVAMGNSIGIMTQRASRIGGAGPDEGNVISGNENAGVYVFGGNAGAAQILGNRIGTDRTGTVALGNLSGIYVDSSTDAIIGGTGNGEGNVISGNVQSGVEIYGPDSVVHNNRIGVGADDSQLGNGTDGIRIGSSPTTANNTIGGTGPGEANVIAHNGGPGIRVQDNANDVVGNELSGNAIHDNGGLGISMGGGGVTANDTGDTDLGPNRLQNFPVLTAASTTAVDGTLDSVAGATYRVELFANATCDPSGNGEGEIFLGAVTGVAPGSFSFDPAGAVDVGDVITATATNETTGDTSEFSACVTAVAGDAASFTVTTTDDTTDAAGCTVAHCSLREAITRANTEAGHDTIGFAIDAPLVDGAHTISPSSALPAITEAVDIDATTDDDFGSCADGPVVVIDGASAGAPNVVGLHVTSGGSTITGLAISRFSGHGMRLETGGGNVVTCNYLGTDVTGSVARGNQFGIVMFNSANNTIGGDGPGEGNLISGSSSNTGLVIQNASSTGNVVQGNLIGTAADGVSPLGNAFMGVRLIGGAANNTIGGATAGAGNVIAFNAGAGISIGAGNGNRFLGNAIHDNTDLGQANARGLGIDLQENGVTPNDTGDVDTVGPNRLQNYPEILSATTTSIDGTLDSTPGTHRLEFFRSGSCDPLGNGEGTEFLGALTAQPNGAFSFDPAGAVEVGDVVTATATKDTTGDTSEFSACLAAVAGDAPSFTVTTTDDVTDASGCTVAHCSLREAITRANAEAGHDTIAFDIDEQLVDGAHTIRPTSGLPTITDPVTIDGMTEPDAGSCPDGQVIELDGSLAGGGIYGLMVLAGSSTIRGLIVNRWAGGAGIRLQGPGSNVATCNYVGTDVAGTAAAANGWGIHVVGTTENTVGGPMAADRNVVSGNTYDGIYVESEGGGPVGNTIQGNYVGTNAAGTAALMNGFSGIHVQESSHNLVGGTAPGEGNLLSGNLQHGILVEDDGTGSITVDTTIQGNRIGTNAAGTAVIPNSSTGVLLWRSKDNLVGGTEPGAGNVIGGNPIGVQILNGAIGNRVEGNWIGTDASGTVDLGNDRGVFVIGTTGKNTIGGTTPGAANVIAFNDRDGVLIWLNAQRASVLGNVIRANTEQGIDLDGEANSFSGDGVTANDVGVADIDAGANGLQNYPVLASATTASIQGTLDSAPGTTYQLQFFANPACDPSGHGEGESYLGELTAQAPGTFTFDPAGVVEVGDVITATATNETTGDTSEFSACATVEDEPDPFDCPDATDAIREALPPADLRLNGLESDECILLFAEQQDVALAGDLVPFAPRLTGMAESGAETVLLVEDRVVSSYLLHTDAVGDGSQPDPFLQGSWTFDERILGVFIGEVNIDLTDEQVGLTGPGGLTYEANHGARGMEFGTPDALSVDPSDPRTLHVSIDLDTMDEIRVLTGLGPEDCVPPQGSDIVEAFPPADLSLNGSSTSNRPKYESDDCLFLFAERQNVALPQDINPSAPTVENIFTADEQRNIPEDTVVDAYLIHGDRIGAPVDGVRLEGTWTFPEPILGISAASDGLEIGDTLVGLNGTRGLTYDPVSGPGDVRGSESGDFVGIVPGDPYSIRVELEFNSMDEIRVWTGVIDPPVGCPPGTPIQRAYPPADLSLDGDDPGPAPDYEDACIYLFEEARDVPLGDTISGIAPKTSGNMVGSTARRTIPENTIVSSYLLHADFPGPWDSPTGATMGGTWTFDAPILGVSYTLADLKTGEDLVGHPEITYEQSASFRGLEAGDSVRVSPTDPNTLIVSFVFNAMDELRVWTGTVTPPVCAPSPINHIVEGFAPANLHENGDPPNGATVYESDECLFLFEEQQDVELTQDVTVSAPLTTNVTTSSKKRQIPAETVVDAYLLHADRVGTPSAGVRRSGTWTFDQPILGFSRTSVELRDSDALVGLSGIAYDPVTDSSDPRGAESGDLVRVVPGDPYSIYVEFEFSFMDEIRIWTGVVDPPVCDLDLDNPIIEAFPPADLSQDGLDPDPALTYEHPACLFLFDEGEHTLPQAVNPVAPKTTNMVVTYPGTRRIPAGTVVETYLVHGDYPGLAPHPTGTEITATWTFDDPILAVSYRTDGLLIGDDLVGHPAITYEPSSSVRGLEPGSPDSVWVDPIDPNKLHMTFAYNAMDEIRVWTGYISPQPGTIRVVKNANPDSGLDVAFTTTDLDPAEFSLDDDANPTLPSSIEFSTAPGDGYAVAETVPDGWDLASASCDDGSPVSNIDVSSGETVTCTFHNVQRGRIVIQKQVLPDGSTETFDFDPSWAANFTLGDGDSHDSGLLVPNLYSVAELPTPGWAIASATCDDGSQPNGIVVSPGEVVTCTFTNQRVPGRIIVEKVASGAAIAFAFDASWTASDFFLANGDTHNSGPLEPGAYAVSEAAVVGWDQTGASCDDGSSPASIDLAPGEVVTCTFTNVERGAILIRKETLPDGSPEVFTFNPSWSATDFSLGDGGSHGSGRIVPGLYSVVETLPPLWSVTSATCDDGSEIDGIVLSAGETVICTIVNQQHGRITIVKDAQPDGPTDFAFTDDIPGCDIGTLDDDLDGTLPRQASCVTVNPGTFQVTESDPGAGYPLQSIGCDDTDSTTSVASRTATLVVGPGEHVTCTFTNVTPTETGTIRIIKQTDPDGSTQPFSFDPSWSATDFSLADGQIHTAPGLSAGTYSVVETVPATWFLSGTACSDGSPVGAIALTAGETVTCTFTNTQFARIIVDKVTLPASGQGFPFRLTGGPDAVDQTFSLADGTPPRDSDFTLRPGTYTVSETLPPSGWDLTSITCGGDPDGTFDVTAGATVTCVFTNTQRGTIRVDKTTVPANDPQSFAFALTGGPDAVNRSFNLTHAATPFDSGPIKPGTYSVAETLPASGWDLTGINCGGDLDGTFALAAGQTITCVFTNSKWGRIRVDKTTSPTNDPQLFPFTLTGGPVAVNQSFSLAHATAIYDSGLIRPGTYVVSEGAMRGWELRPPACSDGSPATAVAVSAGEIVTCTFTNWKIPLTFTKTQQNVTGGIAARTTSLPVQLGDTVRYALSVKNDGPGTAPITWVSDVLEPRLRVQPLPAECSSSAISGGRTLVRCNLGTIAPNATAAVSIDVRVRFGPCTSLGTRGNDTLGEVVAGGGFDDNVTNLADIICGLGGADRITGQGGNDTIYGNQPLPNDPADLQPIDNTAWLNYDADTDATADAGEPLVTVRATVEAAVDLGDPLLDGGLGDDTIFGQDGGDVMFGRDGIDVLRGSVGNDTLNGDAGNDDLYGDGDNDTLNGDAGVDEQFGGDGNDTLNGDAGADDLFGNDGNDTLNGNADNDELFGGDGNDTLAGGDQDDELDGGTGSDLLNGGDHDDQLWGGMGMDILLGGTGRDRLAGDMRLGDGASPTANAGDPDHLNGGSGDDLLYGQGGNDCIRTTAFRACPNRSAIPINPDYVPQLYGASEHDGLHGGDGIDRLDGGPEAGNALVGGDGGSDFCSFGPNDGDLRAPSCEEPSTGDDTIPWDTWLWKKY